MDTLLIGTHDSVTGEKPIWYFYPFLLFSRTQSKTIKEQYDSGCRQFDIRFKKHLGKWRGAHGLYFTKKSAEDIIREIDNFPETCYVTITYEGKLKHNEEYLEFVHYLKEKYNHIVYGPIAVKFGKDTKGFSVKYDVLEKGENGYIGGKQGFLALDGRSWHTYLPIPWLWNRLYTSDHKFNNELFTYVDFL